MTLFSFLRNRVKASLKLIICQENESRHQNYLTSKIIKQIKNKRCGHFYSLYWYVHRVDMPLF